MKLFRGSKIFILQTVLLVALNLTACFNSAPTNETNQNTTTEVQIPDSNINLTKPLEVSQKPEDVALAKKIDEAIEKSQFSNARWGVFVVSLKDGRILAAHDAQKLFNPASVQKI